jgi:hypothetical protein
MEKVYVAFKQGFVVRQDWEGVDQVNACMREGRRIWYKKLRQEEGKDYWEEDA